MFNRRAEVLRCSLKQASLCALGLILFLPVMASAQSGSVPLQIQRKDCSTETRLRSRTSLLSAALYFVNRSKTRVKIYWVNYNGKREHYFDLEPNQFMPQPTYVSHPWVITNADENQPCLGIFIPDSSGTGMVIVE